jgi:hypothetical protein
MTVSPERIAEVAWNDCVKREFLCYAMCATQPEISQDWTPSYLYSQACWHTAKVIGFTQQLAEENNINLADALNALTAYGHEEHDKNLTSPSSDFSLDAVWKALGSKS